jgi:multiple sugar transport system ATP-binding protein
MEKYIVLDNISKVYKNSVKAVNDFNVEISKGDFVALVGPSGCGKSTTLRMIAGLESITSGTLFIEGKVANYLPSKDRDIAFVFQSYALYPHLSVFDNMAFGLKTRRINKAEIKQRVFKASDILNLGSLLDRRPKELSGGQMQRVALGRAIVRHASIFLMDEPLSNLDAKLRIKMRSEIVKLHKEIGSTTIYVTHDQLEAITMANKIVVMNLGYIQQIGNPMDIYNNPHNLFVATFFGTPTMNIIKVLYENESLDFGSYKYQLKDFKVKHDAFYQEKISKVKGILANLENGLAEYYFYESHNIEGENKKKIETIELEQVKVYFEKKLNLLEEALLSKHQLSFGIRPEHLVLSKEGIKGEVIFAEPLGSQIILHLNNDVQLLLNIDDYRNEEIITYLFNESKFYIFDNITGERII